MKTSAGKSKAETLRQKAEGILKNKKLGSKKRLTEDEELKLLHELQVHQIELELQNDELIQAKEQVETVSEKYTELFDFAPIGYFILSHNAEILELNFQGAKILGKERSQLQKNHFGLFISNDSKVVFNAFIENVFRSYSTENCEVTISSKSDSKMFVYLTGIAKLNEKQCFVTAVDITHRKQLEAELTLAKEHAEESNRLKTAFLQNMSHEIRTPLNAIKGFSQLLIRNFTETNKLQKFTKIIDQRCDDLLDIINDILDIAKIESGQLPVYMEECNLDELFDELRVQFAEYQQRQSKQHIKFSLHNYSTASGTVIFTDKGKLKQILVNLLTNAFKFTNKGIIEGGCNFENNKLVFFVSDTGIGIPADKQREVFERFTQLRYTDNRSVGGTGLGLSITRGLVSLLGGDISIISEPGKGSTFSFTFPCEFVQSKNKAPKFTEEIKIEEPTRKTILLVEDDVFNAEYIKEVLLETGLNILLAETGKEAIDIASTRSVDIVLMDIGLPDMDGYQSAEEIKKQKPAIKFIAQTAYASVSDKQKAFDEGFNDYISKPINADALLSMVSRHLKD